MAAPEPVSKRARMSMMLQIDTSMFRKDASFRLEHDKDGLASFNFCTRDEKGTPEAKSISQHGEKGFRLSDFVVGRALGRGVGGDVHKAYHRPSKLEFALKEVNVSISSPRDQLKKELRMHSECGKMQNIVDLYDVFYDEGRVYLVLELMSWGSLEDLIKIQRQATPPVKMDEYLLAYTMREVLTALNYLHAEHKLVHRDVKPGNILLNHAGEVKLSDFGTARLSSDPGSLPATAGTSSAGPLSPLGSAARGHAPSETPPDTASFGTNFVGTTGYMSPQQLNDEYHSYCADIWSLGIVALECAAGRHPYSAGGEMTAGVLGLVHRVLSEDPPTAEGLGMSPEFEAFVGCCLRVKEAERASAAELLQHEFITKNTDDVSKFRMSCWLARFERGGEEDD